MHGHEEKKHLDKQRNTMLLYRFHALNGHKEKKTIEKVYNASLDIPCFESYIVTAGVPIVTWSVEAEQFYSEKLVIQVLKIGISVGVQQWTMYGDSIKSEFIKKAANRITEGSEAEEMRSKAMAFGKMARKAAEEGGSSRSNLNSLIEELKLNHN
ncbi:hypothetical protein GH714_033724 [Hevea brasiliensis]|uniref:Uncharacterized protein n=1 Tax=Hevea brasiliensis TaxID=3981 RepID=A0A6A6N6X9_HEVBR|nr:hypothetical protein GH714_033724 [Hevea brasiliensis]